MQMCPWGVLRGTAHVQLTEILKITLGFATFYIQVSLKDSAGVL